MNGLSTNTAKHLREQKVILDLSVCIGVMMSLLVDLINQKLIAYPDTEKVKDICTTTIKAVAESILTVSKDQLITYNTIDCLHDTTYTMMLTACVDGLVYKLSTIGIYIDPSHGYDMVQKLEFCLIDEVCRYLPDIDEHYSIKETRFLTDFTILLTIQLNYE